MYTRVQRRHDMAFIVKCRRCRIYIIITAVTCIYCRSVHKRYSLMVVAAVVARHVATVEYNNLYYYIIYTHTLYASSHRQTASFQNYYRLFAPNQLFPGQQVRNTSNWFSCIIIISMILLCVPIVVRVLLTSATHAQSQPQGDNLYLASRYHK